LEIASDLHQDQTRQNVSHYADFGFNLAWLTQTPPMTAAGLRILSTTYILESSLHKALGFFFI